MKSRQYLLGVALVGALGLALFGDKSPWDNSHAEIIRVVEASSGSGSSSPSAPKPRGIRRTTEAATEMPLVSRTQWADSTRTQAPRDIFAVRAPVALTPAQAPRMPVAQVPPPALALQATVEAGFSVLGKQHDGQSWAIYLARGSGVWIAREGGTVDSHYAVESIDPPTMVLRRRDTGVVQRLDIGAAP